ncbi:uncharacterized protein LOC125672404 [Ostrea edulis]|uniref:uncharacterized protein LOC125672404 n=1 Tax=Ostrea edulis TaxID=37623 RepID=UPI0020947D82|nr:uncharacterized protein LOC125672404 [Ostrea edulis]
MRPLWRHYYKNSQALVFVFDSVDRERITEARELLYSIPTEDELNGVPVAIALNKRDLPDCMTREEMVEKLDLRKIQKQRPCEAFLTTVKPTAEVDSEFDKLLEWITKETAKRRKAFSPKNQKVDPFSYIWQPIMKVKNMMFN